MDMKVFLTVLLNILMKLNIDLFYKRENKNEIKLF